MYVSVCNEEQSSIYILNKNFCSKMQAVHIQFSKTITVQQLGSHPEPNIWH